MARTTTNSSRVGEKLLSHRLAKLHQEYHHETHVWDIGCDHGLLGLSFLDTETVREINLVDPSLAVVHDLQKKIKASYITKAALNILHKRGQNLILHSSSHCIFIAGMGGKEIAEIIEAILPQLDQDSRIVISPHRKILELRKVLHSLPLMLVREFVIYEDEQYYQVLTMVPSTQGKRVGLYGNELWLDERGRAYRDHQISTFSTHQDQASRAYVEYLKQITY